MIFKHGTAVAIVSSTLVFSSLVYTDAATFSNSTASISAGDIRVSSSTTKISGENITFAQVLSSSYNRPVSTSEVVWLRTEFDFGLGDISLLYAASVYSGRPVNEISQLRLKNMGWGEIAKLYGVKVKDLKKGSEKVVSLASERGVDVTYIEIREDRNSDDHRAQEHQDSSQNEKNGHKKNQNNKGNNHNK